MGKTKTKPEQALWYSTQEVADAWGISVRTVYRWLEEGVWVEGEDFTRSTPYGTGAYFWAESALPTPEERK